MTSKNSEKNDINEFLQRYNHVKEQINSLEKKLENYKRYATKIMEENNINTISNDEFTLTKRQLKKRTIGKDDLPFDLYMQYSKVCSYDAFYLTKHGNKITKSPRKKKNTTIK